MRRVFRAFCFAVRTSHFLRGPCARLERASPHSPKVGTEFENPVPLDPNGDFEIDDTLKLIGGVDDAVPSECASPTLLIRAANGAWLAAGIPNLRNQ